LRQDSSVALAAGDDDCGAAALDVSVATDGADDDGDDGAAAELDDPVLPPPPPPPSPPAPAPDEPADVPEPPAPAGDFSKPARTGVAAPLDAPPGRGGFEACVSDAGAETAGAEAAGPEGWGTNPPAPALEADIGGLLRLAACAGPVPVSTATPATAPTRSTAVPVRIPAVVLAGRRETAFCGASAVSGSPPDPGDPAAAAPS